MRAMGTERMKVDGRRIAILVGGVLLCGVGGWAWGNSSVLGEAPLGGAPRAGGPLGTTQGDANDAAGIRVPRLLTAAPKAVPLASAPADACPVLGCELARAVLGDVLETLAEECTGEGLAWRIRPRERVLAAVRRNAAPLAVLADRPGVPAPPDLECVEFGDLVLVALASGAAKPSLLTATQFRRLLDGGYARWSRVSGPDQAVEPIGIAGVDARVAGRLFGVEPAGFEAGLTAPELLGRLERASGGLGIASLQSLETARLDAAGRDRMLAIDGIEPSREAYRRGHYPFGVTLRVVAAPGADDDARCLLGALRRLGRHHASTAGLCVP